MPSGATAQDPTWRSKEQADEARYVHEKEQAQIAAIRNSQQLEQDNAAATAQQPNRDIEGGYGGQEDLEDRYATTSGEH